MASVLCQRGDSKSFSAGLQDHPSDWSTLQEGDELVCPPAPFADDFSISRADTDLTVLASQVDADVIHSSASRDQVSATA